MTQDVTEVFQLLFFGTDEVVLIKPFEVFISQPRPSDEVLLASASPAAAVSHIVDSVDIGAISILWKARVKRRWWLGPTTFPLR